MGDDSGKSSSVIGAIADGVGQVIGVTFERLGTFLSRGAEKGCGPYEERVNLQNGGIICRGKWPDDSTRPNWLIADSGVIEAPKIHYKPAIRAEDRMIASNKNCEPGTFAYNGACWSACTPEFERQLVEPTDADEKAGLSKKKIYRCIAKCKNQFHPLDSSWTQDSKAANKMNIPADPSKCYHTPADAYWIGGTLDQLKAALPYNLILQRELISDKTPHTGGHDPNDDDPWEKAGIYVDRVRFAIPPAVDPLPCVAPYQVTASGRCVRECAAGFKLFGENCYHVKLECPKGWVEAGVGAYCAAKVRPMPRYWSLMTIIMAIGGAAIAAALLAKVFIGASSSSSR